MTELRDAFLCPWCRSEASGPHDFCGGSFLDTEHRSVVRPVLVVLEDGELTAQERGAPRGVDGELPVTGDPRVHTQHYFVGRPDDLGRCKACNRLREDRIHLKKVALSGRTPAARRRNRPLT